MNCKNVLIILKPASYLSHLKYENHGLFLTDDIMHKGGVGFLWNDLLDEIRNQTIAQERSETRFKYTHYGNRSSRQYFWT